MIHGLFAEYCNAVFKMEVQFYERFEWKVFHNTNKCANAKKCKTMSILDIVHMFGKFTLIKELVISFI